MRGKARSARRTRQSRAIAGHTPLPLGGSRTWRRHLAATRADAAATPVASRAAATRAARPWAAIPADEAAIPVASRAAATPAAGRAAATRAARPWAATPADAA